VWRKSVDLTLTHTHTHTQHTQIAQDNKTGGGDSVTKKKRTFRKSKNRFLVCGLLLDIWDCMMSASEPPLEERERAALCVCVFFFFFERFCVCVCVRRFLYLGVCVCVW